MSITPSMAVNPVLFGTLSRKQRIAGHLQRTNTPDFQQNYNKVFENARKNVESRIKAGQSGLVVLDIDETTLDNRGYFADPARQYYQKSPGRPSIAQTWQAWVNRAEIPAIPAAKRFIDWLNAQQVPYVFLTGIRENLRTGSEQSLVKAGVWGPACLGAFYRPDSFEGGTAAFKRLKRPELEQTFQMPILATIGDQPGDMTGDPAKDFLLPDYVKALRRENDQG